MARADREVLALGERERALARGARRPPRRDRHDRRGRGRRPPGAERGPDRRRRRPGTADRGRTRDRVGPRTTPRRRRRPCARPTTPSSRHGSGSMRSTKGSSSSWPGWASSGSRGSRPQPASGRGRPGSRAPSARAGRGTGRRPGASEDEETVSDDAAELEAALALVTPIWAAQPPASQAPSPARLGQLRRRFHELGAVNPYAVDEYAALKERLETLETQASDLRTAIVRTRDLIVELDTMIADRFRTTFEALEAAFSTRFEQLFGGGFAKLSLTDPSDLGATGIEIVARPPGKKAQALAMLSGGERALTAVALLFAMLEVRPVPFCVLDEVDAALDEANIGRFADALRSLAHADPVHRHHPQPRHDRGGRRALRRDRRRRLGQPGHQPPARRGAGARRARSGPNGAGRVGFAACPSGDAVTTKRPPNARSTNRSIPTSSTRRGSPIRPTSRTPPTRPMLRRRPRTRDDGGAGRSAPPVRPAASVRRDHRDADARASGRTARARHGRNRSARPNRRSPATAPSRSHTRSTPRPPSMPVSSGPAAASCRGCAVPWRRRDRRPVLGRRRGDAHRRRCRSRPGHRPRRARPPESRAGRPRSRHPHRACRPARRPRSRLEPTLADRRQPGRRARRRRQRDGQDHDDRQACQPLQGRGPVGHPRRRGHVPRRRDRPAPDLGRSGRRADGRPRPGRRPRAPSSTTRSMPPWRVARTSSSPTRPAAFTRART